MKFLLIETATPVCSVALATEHGIVASQSASEPNAHSSRLPSLIEQLWVADHSKPQDISAVCVSSGPGSYTGLRIGVAYAKGLCYALHIPLLAVPTPQAIADGYYLAHPDFTGNICPMIDARRMECYTAIYTRNGESNPANTTFPTLPNSTQLRDIQADIIDSNSYREYLQQAPLLFIGDGAAKTQPLFTTNPNARYDLTYSHSADGLLPQALSKFNAQAFEDVAYFEPFYLKDFVAKKSIVRGLR